MTWQAFGVIVALVGVLLTLLLNLRSQRQTAENLRLNREGLGLAKTKAAQDERSAEAAASRSEAAARLTEEYTRRVVDALESMASNGLGAGSAAPSRVRWSMEWDRGDTYRLTNVGDATAYAVSLSAVDPSLINWFEPPEAIDLASGEALTFMAGLTMATTDSTITVHWTDGEGFPQEWRYPLPAKP